MRTLSLALISLLVLAAVHPARAQISFRAASSATAAGITPAFRSAASAATTGATLTITKPSGVAANDVLVASIAVTPSSVVINAPTGWTLIRRLNNASSTSNSLAVYYKVAIGGEPASYAWGVSGGSFAVGGIQAFTGVDTASPVDIENGQTTASSTSHAAPGVNSTVANAMVVTSHGYASSRTWTPPSGMTESFDRPSGGNSATGLSVEGNRVLQSVAGATGNKTATAAGDADAGNAHTLVLRPAKMNLAIPTPAGTVPNDVMIAAIGFNNSSAAITPAAGWTLVRRTNNASTTSNALAIYRRVAIAGEPASHAWMVAGGAFLVGGIQSFAGVSVANPVDAENGQSTASSTNHDTPSITTSAANAMLVTAHTYASANNWTPQAGLAEGFDRPSGSNSSTGQSLMGGYQLQAVAGVTGTKRSTAGGSADVGNTHILALRPNAPPTVTLTSPANGTTIHYPATINVTATANDPDGTVAYVDFYTYGCLGESEFLGRVTQPPYAINWDPWPVLDPYCFDVWAVAGDNHGVTGNSNVVQVTVVRNVLPSVSLISPASNATFNAPASISLEAQAADSDGSIAKVEFLYGSTLIATLTSAPYQSNWTGVPQGVYTLTARATDNKGGTTTSAAVNVTVNAAVAQLHFIHVDHLNTPRLITNQAQQALWRRDNQEPFGDSPADENPSGLGVFEFDLGFPGQRRDKETNLHYNYFRDYDPSIGRYVESDPIGLRGGLNTYAYVNGNPVSFVDPTGESWPTVVLVAVAGTWVVNWFYWNVINPPPLPPTLLKDPPSPLLPTPTGSLECRPEMGPPPPDLKPSGPWPNPRLTRPIQPPAGPPNQRPVPLPMVK